MRTTASDDVDEPGMHDVQDDDDGSSPRRDRAAENVIAAVAVVGAAVVVGLFFVTIAHLQPVPDVGVVVVADPAVAPGAPLHARVLGIGGRGRATFTGTVNGIAVDARGLVVVPRVGSLAVVGAVDGVDTRIDVPLPAPAAPPDASVKVVPWSRALALPAKGAAVYPEAGLVTGRGMSRVILVDDAAVEVFDVHAGADARLPDGRLLFVDRLPLQARLRSLRPAPGGELVVDVVGVGAADDIALELLVGGVTRALVDVRGPGGHALRVPADARPGDLVVARVATSPLPSSTGRVLVTRVGGPSDDDLVAVEPRIAHVARQGIDEEVLQRALLARLAPVVRQTPVVSSSLHAQVARRTAERDAAAMAWRERMRLAAAALAGLVLVVAAGTARRAPAVAAGAVLVVVVLFVGLDVVVGAMTGGAG